MKSGFKIFVIFCLTGMVAMGVGCSRQSLSKQNYRELAPAPESQKAPVIPEEAKKIPRPL